MKRILAADIGGTNSRFAVFVAQEGRLAMAESTRLRTHDAASFPDLLARLAASGFSLTPEASDITVLAVPGAVEDRGFARPPNIPWTIDVRGLRSGGPQFLVNDFVAQAFACRTPAVAQAREIQPGQPQADGVLAAVGAGTGLGHCALLPTAAGPVAMPAEAGHVAFPFVGDEEYAFQRFVMDRAQVPYAYGDLVVTGRGLSFVHEFLTGQALAPAEVGAVLARHPHTVELFARFYGRACRSYALTVLSLAGLYVVGGVAAKNPELVEHPAFRREFVASPTYGWLLEAIPVHLNLNEDSGLWGAAAYGLAQAG